MKKVAGISHYREIPATFALFEEIRLETAP
jgi:hypothetical protein